VQGLHSWRQSQTCLNIRNFTRNDFNIFNPRVGHYNVGDDNIKRYEFPVMQWLIAGIQRVCGEHHLILRFSMLFIYFLSLYGMWLLAFEIFKSRGIALLSLFVLSFFPVYLYQSINVMPDNFALMLSLYFLYFFFKGVNRGDATAIIISALFLCFSALSKLPFILFGIMPLVYFFKKGTTLRYKVITFIAFGLILIPVISWYLTAVPEWGGNDIAQGIFSENFDTAEYFIFLLKQLQNNIPMIVLGYPQVGLLILSVILLLKNRVYKRSHSWYWISAFVTYVFYFMFVLQQIGKGHDYYFYPFLPIFTIGILYLFNNIKTISKFKRYLAYFLLLTSPVWAYAKVKDFWQIDKAYFNDDLFVHKTQLKNAVPNDKKCIMVNDYSNYILPYAIDKSGYVFRNDYLPIEWIKDLSKNQNVKYLYSDSRKVEGQIGFDSLVQEKLLSVGSYNVFLLR